MKLSKNLMGLFMVIMLLAVTAHSALAKVSINEFVSDPATGNEWIELYNSDTKAEDLTKFTLEDGNEPANEIAIIQSSIEGKSYVIIEPPKSVLNNPEDTINLKETKDGVTKVVDSISYGKGKTIEAPTKDASGNVRAGARLHDGHATWIITTEPTKNAANNRLPTANDNTVTVDEDKTHTFKESDFKYSDADSDKLASVKITALETKGDLKLDGKDVVLNQVIATANLGKLTYAPKANENGANYDSFTFSVKEDKPVEAESTKSYKMTVAVTAVNDNPTSKDKTITLTEDATHTFSSTDFEFTDVEDTSSKLDSTKLTSVKITALETKGDLKLTDKDGKKTDVVKDQFIALADLAKLSFTPKANENGAPYTTFKFKVVDSEKAESSEHTFTFDVTGENDAPTSKDFSKTILEDNEYKFTGAEFSYTDADGDKHVSIKITSLETKGTLTFDGKDVTKDQVIPVADLNKISFTPLKYEFSSQKEDKSYNDYATFKFTVNDGKLDSQEYTGSFIVTPVNNKPVVDALTAQTAIEGIEFSYKISGTDVDNDDKNDLSINLKKSTIAGTPLELSWLKNSKGLVLNGIPDVTAKEAGKLKLSLVLTDGSLDSDAKEVEIIIKPAFEILKETITVKINDNAAVELKSLTDGKKFEVDFNDKVIVTYKYKNNLEDSLVEKIINFLLGKVEAKATSKLDTKNDLYNNNDIAPLQSGKTASDSFSFTIDPKTNFAGKDFDVDLSINGKTSSDKAYADKTKIPFTIVKKAKNVIISEKVKISDDTITCNKNPELTLKIKNTGENKLDPEVWVFDKAAVFDTKTGKFTTTGELVHLTYTKDFKDPKDANKAASEIEPNAEATLTFPVDLSKLSSAGKLYVYVTNDFFKVDKGDWFIGGEDTIEIKKVGTCLKKAELEKVLTIGKNTKVATEVDLLETDGDGEYKFIDEEKGTASKLEFSVLADSKDDEGKDILGQSNKNLIDCSINEIKVLGDKQKITCKDPAEGKDGSSKVTVVLNNKLTTTAKTFNEDVTIKVSESLKFTSITFNGKSATEAEKGVTVKPLETLKVLFKAKNFNVNEVKDLNVEFTGNDIGLFKIKKDATTPAGLKANSETGSHTLDLEVPLATKDGTYNLYVELTAKSLDEKITYSEKLEFRLMVESNPAEVLVKAELADAKFAEVTCNNDIQLKVDLTNPGNINHKVAITIKDGSTVLYDSLKKNGNPAEKDVDMNLLIDVLSGQTLNKVIPVKVSGAEGKHALTVDIAFNHNKDGKANNQASATALNVNKKKCINDKFTPKENNVPLQDGKKQTFTIEVVEAGFDVNKISWDVTTKDKDGKVIPVGNKGTGSSYDFSSNAPGTYTVTATINADKVETKTWTVTVTDKPVDLATFGIDSTKITTPNKVTDLVVSKDDITVKFTEETDLSDVAELAKVVTLTKVDADKRIVAIDSATAPGLNKKATITVKNFPTGKTHVYRYDGFGKNVKADSKADCETAAKCTKPVVKDGTVTFDVTGFSQFEIVNEKDAKLEPSVTEVLSTKNAGESDKLTFSLKNTGTLAKVTNIKYDTTSISTADVTKYAFKISGVPTELDALKSATVTIELTIPKDEDAGSKIKIGDLKFTSDNGDVTLPLAIQPKSALSVDLSDIEINGKSSGDLSIEDENEIEVTVKNGLTEDLERVSITVEILDVDGEDLQEESDDFDLDAGEDEKETLKFDLSSEVIDEEEYTVRVTVEGRTVDNGTKHKTVVTKKVNVDIEKHKLILDKASLSTTELSCSRFTTLSLGAKNIGSSNEDDVEIHVTSTELGITGKRTGLELDDFSKSDNDYDTSFGLDLQNAPAGTYPITVELFRDNDKLEDSKTLTVTIKDCATLVKQESEQAQQVSADKALTEQMQAQLQAQLLAQQQQVQKQANNIQGNFRESDNYVMLLGILIVLVFIALVLAVAVMVLKKK